MKLRGDGAIIAEWLGEHGGAERVITEMARCYPDFQIFTIAADVGALPEISPRRIEPILSENYRRCVSGRRGAAVANAALWPLWGRKLSPDQTIISSHHLGSHWAAIGSTAHHLAYVHTPARYAWFPHLDSRASSAAARMFGRIVRGLDRRAATSVAAYAANSRTTQARISQVWGRQAHVIYPPVQRPPVMPELSVDSDYLVSCARFVPYKRHDFAIAVAEELGKPLKIVGGGPLEVELRRLAAAATVRVDVLTGLTDIEVSTVLARAAALLYPAIEDFGIVPVESMSVGTPVIGLKVGGTAETVISGATGRLVDDLLLSDWVSAFHDIRGDMYSACIERAGDFSAEVFHSRFVEWVDAHT